MKKQMKWIKAASIHLEPETVQKVWSNLRIKFMKNWGNSSRLKPKGRLKTWTKHIPNDRCKSICKKRGRSPKLTSLKPKKQLRCQNKTSMNCLNSSWVIAILNLTESPKGLKSLTNPKVKNRLRNMCLKRRLLLKRNFTIKGCFRPLRSRRKGTARVRDMQRSH